MPLINSEIIIHNTQYNQPFIFLMTLFVHCLSIKLNENSPHPQSSTTPTRGINHQMMHIKWSIHSFYVNNVVVHM